MFLFFSLECSVLIHNEFVSQVYIVRAASDDGSEVDE